MGKTKIDWCDYTWNPVTGCYHNCPYCYAKKIANRFNGSKKAPTGELFAKSRNVYTASKKFLGYEVLQPIRDNTHKVMAYPFGFVPTFKCYELNKPLKLDSPTTIFVCSMADLFGDWVPDEWIKYVFETCKQASQHTYIFLTKNPKRYYELAEKSLLPTKTKMPNMWFGTSITDDTMPYFFSSEHNTFISIEPLLKPFDCNNKDLKTDWAIIGAETGNRSDKVVPERKWISDISSHLKKQNIPVFMKESIKELMLDDFIQEFPQGIILHNKEGENNV